MNIDLLISKDVIDLIKLIGSIFAGIAFLLLVGAIALRIAGVEKLNFKTGAVVLDDDEKPAPRKRVTRKKA